MSGAVDLFFQHSSLVARDAGRRFSGMDIAVYSLKQMQREERDERFAHALVILENASFDGLRIDPDTSENKVLTVIDVLSKRRDCEAFLADRGFRGRLPAGVLAWVVDGSQQDAAGGFQAAGAALEASGITFDFLNSIETRRREGLSIGAPVDPAGEIIDDGDVNGLLFQGRSAEIATHLAGLRRAILAGEHYLLVGANGIGKTTFVRRLAEAAARSFSTESDPRLAGIRFLFCGKRELLGSETEARENFGRLSAMIGEGYTPIIDDVEIVFSPQLAAGEEAVRALGHMLIAARQTFVLAGEREAVQRLGLFAGLQRRILPAPNHEIADRIAADHIGALTARRELAPADSPEALGSRACRLARQNYPNRSAPNAGLQVINGAVELARLHAGQDTVPFGEEELLAFVARDLNTPREMFEKDGAALSAMLNEQLLEKVIAQDIAVTRVAEAVGFGERVSIGQTPRTRLLFAGPPGVGKTYLARSLAEALGYDQEAFMILNMSEYATEGARTRFMGADPGYVGFGNTRTVYDVVRARPSCVILLDEIDRAHPSIQDILLSILEGQGADANGRPVYFSQAIIIATTNLGQEQIEQAWWEGQSSNLSRDAVARKLEDRALRSLILSGAIDPVEQAMQQALERELVAHREAFATSERDRQRQIIRDYNLLSREREALELTRRHSPLDRAFLDRIDFVVPFLPISTTTEIGQIVDLKLRQVGWTDCPPEERDGMVREVADGGSVRMIERVIKDRLIANIKDGGGSREPTPPGQVL